MRKDIFKHMMQLYRDRYGEERMNSTLEKFWWKRANELDEIEFACAFEQLIDMKKFAFSFLDVRSYMADTQPRGDLIDWSKEKKSDQKFSKFFNQKILQMLTDKKSRDEIWNELKLFLLENNTLDEIDKLVINLRYSHQMPGLRDFCDELHDLAYNIQRDPKPLQIGQNRET